MFARQFRLAKRQDIERVLKRGRKFHAKFFTLRVLSNSLPNVRVTVVVGLAVSKHAVVRNRIKRQLREQLRSLLSEKNNAAGHDILLQVRTPVLKVKSEERAIELRRLIKLAKI